LAEAVGLPFSLKPVRCAMRIVPARFQIYVSPAALLRSVQSNEPLQPPWPRLVISIGPRGPPIALAIKRASGAFGLHIGHPKVPAQLFDLVAAPVHDNVEGTNVVTTFGAVHSVTKARLAEAAKRFAPHAEPLPHPRIAILLGGESAAFSFRPRLPPRLVPSLPRSSAAPEVLCWRRRRGARGPTRSPRCLPPSRACRTSCGTAPAIILTSPSWPWPMPSSRLRIR